MDEATASRLALFLADHPNQVSDLTVSYANGLVSPGWYARVIGLRPGWPDITLSHHPGAEVPKRPDLRLDFGAVAAVTVELGDGTIQTFGVPRKDPVRAMTASEVVTSAPPLPKPAPIDVEAEHRRLRAEAVAELAAGRPAEALEKARRACDLVILHLGTTHPFAAEAVAALGELCRATGATAEAAENFRRAVDLGRANLPTGDGRLVPLLLHLARHELQVGDHAAAANHFGEVLDLKGDAADAETVDVLCDLGFAESRAGDLAGAEAAYGQALRAAERGGLVGQASHARTLHNLGLLEAQRGGLAAAEPHFEQALAYRRALFGPQHADVADTQASLATLRYLTQRYAEAAGLYREALAAYETKLPPQHPRVLECLTNLVHVARAMGDEATAKHFGQEYRRRVASSVPG